MKKAILEDIFKFRGQIQLVEKMKGKEDCHCGLCDPSKRLRESTWYDATIALNHYDAIKLFVPMSMTKFKALRKDYEKSFLKKEAYELQLKIDKKLKDHNYKFRPAWRVYPLSKEVYDKFAEYIYEKFGKPKFGKRNIHGVNWGDSQKIEYATRRYGVWTHSRTVGVHLFHGGFEFAVDDSLMKLSNKEKNKWRRKNPKKFPKKLGKLI